MPAVSFGVFFRAVRRGLVAVAGAGLLAVAFAGGAAAYHDDDVAAAGNGGFAVASADGGLVLVGDINSGFNRGGVIVVGW